MTYVGPAGKRLLHVGVTWTAKPDQEAVERVLGDAPDWLRYSGSTWIVRTDENAVSLAERIRSQVQGVHELIVIPVVASEFGGWKPRWVWDWLRKYRP